LILSFEFISHFGPQALPGPGNRLFTVPTLMWRNLGNLLVGQALDIAQNQDLAVLGLSFSMHSAIRLTNSWVTVASPGVSSSAGKISASVVSPSAPTGWSKEIVWSPPARHQYQ